LLLRSHWDQIERIFDDNDDDDEEVSPPPPKMSAQTYNELKVWKKTLFQKGKATPSDPNLKVTNWLKTLNINQQQDCEQYNNTEKHRPTTTIKVQRPISSKYFHIQGHPQGHPQQQQSHQRYFQ
jgi:hypothetical protein